MTSNRPKLAFPEMVQASGLIDAARWQAFLTECATAPPTTPKQWTDRLIAAELLTPFQAQLLLQGRYKHFILAGKYRLLDLIGSGGMGRVFLCEHMAMSRRVAVKVLSRERIRDPITRERFYREARVAARLSHPNIVQVYDLEPDPAMPLLVMEYVDGISLAALVERGGPLSVERAAHYIAQAAEGLQHAYHSGLVHRDIKPQNLLVDRSGIIKILDLGLARPIDHGSGITQQFNDRSIVGTADYLAPEQALMQSVDVRADIYSLGATFYFLLTGEPPFADRSLAQKLLSHQMVPVPSLQQHRTDVPPELDQIVRKMMEKAPNDRYQEPSEIIEALAPWLKEPIAPLSSPTITRLSKNTAPHTESGGPTSTTIPPITEPITIPPPLRRSWRIPLIAMFALVIGVGVWWGLQPRSLPEPTEAMIRPEEALSVIGQERTVEFYVARVGYNEPRRSKLFLNSRSNIQDPLCFTVVIDEPMGKRIDANVAFTQLAQRYENRWVQVHGLVRKYHNRAEIIVTEPSDIRILTDDEAATRTN